MSDKSYFKYALAVIGIVIFVGAFIAFGQEEVETLTVETKTVLQISFLESTSTSGQVRDVWLVNGFACWGQEPSLTMMQTGKVDLGVSCTNRPLVVSFNEVTVTNPDGVDEPK